VNAETTGLQKVGSSVKWMGWLSIIFGILAVYFFVDGFSELMAAFSLKEGKGWLLFDAVVTILLGIMIFTGFPLAGTVAIGVFLGVKLLFVGVTMLTLRSAVRNVF
jgi:uncharacterized membrane protein HdeD (DUF308 family)